MEAKVYDAFKETKPRIRTYERKGSEVVITCTCSLEQEHAIKELEKMSEEIRLDFCYEDTVWFTVRTRNEELSENLVKDFF